MRRIAVLALAAVLSLASASPMWPHVAYAPMAAQAPPGVTDEDLTVATVRVFTRNGWGLRARDEGVVVTEWMRAYPAAGAPLHAWRVVIAEGEVLIQIDGPDDSNRYPDWVDAMPGLRDAIFAEAERRARKRRARETAATQPTE